MKTQHETTIQFSGYPLGIVEKTHRAKQVELTIVKPSQEISSQNKSIANDPKNWDIDWFNSYE